MLACAAAIGWIAQARDGQPLAASQQPTLGPQTAQNAARVSAPEPVPLPAGWSRHKDDDGLPPATAPPSGLMRNLRRCGAFAAVEHACACGAWRVIIWVALSAGFTFYHHSASGRSQWEPPTETPSPFSALSTSLRSRDCC